MSLPISRREINGCKVPSTYATNFLQVLYSSIFPFFGGKKSSNFKNRKLSKCFCHISTLILVWGHFLKQFFTFWTGSQNLLANNFFGGNFFGPI